MKKLLSLLVILISLVSCTAPDLASTIKSNDAIKPASTTNTFTVVWRSNQVEPYVEFTKHVFKNCKIVSTELSVHTNTQFDITLENGQMFDLQIKRKETAIRPNLYLAIYKNDVLQFEREVDTHGYMMSNFVDSQGNISCQPSN